MSARTSVLPNLLNGVSTQSVTLRLLTQGEEQINGYSTLTNGLIKRPPSLLLRNMGNVANATNSYVHLINRDAAERYYVMITNGDLRVYDLAGNQKVVNFPHGKGYLSNAVPRTGFSAVTVADYTFVVNRNVTAAMSGARTPSRWPEALVNVLTGNYSKSYRIFINGSAPARYDTGDGAADSNSPDGGQREVARKEQRAIATNLIASALCWGSSNPGSTVNGHYVSDGEPAISNAGEGTIHTGLVNNLPKASWDLWKVDSAIYINARGANFNIRVEDGFNGNAMKVVKGKCQRFTDLPLKAPNGFHVEITGESSNNFDNYYVAFETTNNEFEGVWKETVAQNVAYQFDASTMPHVLVREWDGSFTFRRATWNERKVGDDNSAPVPSFIGQRINDVFYHRGRLGMIAGENVCLSASSDVFNFWRKTVTAVLDTDPIDIGPSFPKVSVFKHAQSFNGDLLLFSEGLQARLTGGDVLTPKTAAMKLLGEFQVDTNVKPVSTGAFMYWTAKDNNRTIFREMWLDETGTIQPPLEANSHCPEYIPKNVFKIASSTDLNMLVAVSSDQPTRLYVYKYYWSGKEKPQSSWSYWEFGRQIISADFVDTDLYLLIQDGSDTRLLKVPCQVGATDPNMRFMVMLDQRVYLDGSMATYDPVQDHTSYVLPYAPPSTVEAWAGFSIYAPSSTGRKLPVRSVSGTTLRLAGDTRANVVYAGIPYTFVYRFSPFHIRVDNGNGSSLVATEGRTQVLRVRLTYAKTVYFSVRVTHETKPTVEYKVNDHLLDDGLFSTTEIYPEDGDYSFPVKAENDKVWIDILNDQAVPSSLISAEWVGLWYPKSRRM